MLADRGWLYTYRLHRRVVSLRDVNAGGGKHAYHSDRCSEYEKRNTIHRTLPFYNGNALLTGALPPVPRTSISLPVTRALHTEADVGICHGGDNAFPMAPEPNATIFLHAGFANCEMGARRWACDLSSPEDVALGAPSRTNRPGSIPPTAGGGLNAHYPADNHNQRYHPKKGDREK